MFDTGYLNLYELRDVSVDGMMPKTALVFVLKCYYGERTVSYARWYAAQGANTSVDLVVRIPFDITVTTEQFVILEDGNQYRIDAISDVIVKSNKRAKELSLVRLEDFYDVADIA